MTTATSQAAASEELLPADLRVELWKRIERRLRKGEVLITSEQFFKAMAKDFKRLVRVDPDRRIKIELLQMIIQVNETHPETYLTMGIKNAVKTFIQDAQKGGADEEGTESLQEMMASMVREGRTAMWLEGMGINVDERTLTTRLEQTILSIIEGKKVRGRAERRERTRRQRRPASEMVGVRTTEVEAVGEAEPPAVEGPPTMEEQQQRAAEEKERTAEMVAEEIERAPRNLDSYQNQKLLSEDEASKLRELYGIGQRLADGEIDDEEAQRLRDEIGDVVREKLEARLREAVDHSLHYITTFEALKRLPGDRDLRPPGRRPAPVALGRDRRRHSRRAPRRDRGLRPQRPDRTPPGDHRPAALLAGGAVGRFRVSPLPPYRPPVPRHCPALSGQSRSTRLDAPDCTGA